MIILSCENIVKSFVVDTILEDITFGINEGDRVGIIGSNGCGKSTLFNLITGKYKPDSGNIHIRRDVTLGCLAQENKYEENDTVHNIALRVFDNLIKMEAKLRDLEHNMADTEQDHEAIFDEYNIITERFEFLGGYEFRSKVLGVLYGLGFTQSQLEQNANSLSGGQQTRLALACLLLQSPDILLLDEPTNHLDLAAMQWLEDYLLKYKGTILTISHDRFFLERICTHTLEIENKKAMMFSGAYDDFKTKKAEIIKAQTREREKQTKEIDRQKAIARRFRSYASEKKIVQAKARERLVAKLESKLIDEPFKNKNFEFRFKPKRESGNEVLVIDSLSKSFDQNKLFQNFSLLIRKGERVGIIGSNGIGKSTLLNIITSRLSADTGSFKLGSKVDMGYYDQKLDIDLHKNIIDYLWDFFPSYDVTTIRKTLGIFLFSGDDVFKPNSALSGGEKARVLLSKMMLEQNNFLIFDEPTNHLDMRAREALENALNKFEGTMLMVSHDRYFLEKTANIIIEMKADEIFVYRGTYSEYIEKLNSKKTSETEVEKLSKTERSQRYQKERAEIKERQSQKKHKEKLEKIIKEKEARIQFLEEEFNNPSLYDDSAKMLEYHKEYDSIKKSLEECYEEWMELE